MKCLVKSKNNGGKNKKMMKLPEKIKWIHANFNQNGLVEETGDKINEIIEAINKLIELQEDSEVLEKCEECDNDNHSECTGCQCHADY